MLNEILAHGKAAHHVAKIWFAFVNVGNIAWKKEVTLLLNDLQIGHVNF